MTRTKTKLFIIIISLLLVYGCSGNKKPAPWTTIVRVISGVGK